jgi:hypothetical protein
LLTTSSANPAPGQTFTLTATVSGPTGKPTPTGTIAFLSDGQSFNTYVSLSGGTAAIAIPGYSAANGINIFTALYQGDANYNSAASNAVNVTVAQSDFSLTTQNPEVQISPSGTGVSTLALSPINGFSGTVTLTSSAPTAITATPATASLTLNAPATDAITIKVAAGTATGIYPLTITASGGGHVHTVQILVQVLTVAAPVFSPVAGTYATSQQVTLTDATTGATIYYTTNGAIPNAASTKYTSAITVSATETIQAIAIVSGSAPSSVASAAYTITTPAATPTFSPVPGIYSSVQTVAISDLTPGAQIYYTTNGAAPTTSSTLYTGPITVSATETLKAIATASGSLQSGTGSAVYIINMATNGCPTGSGSCVDNFTGSSGTLLPTYNSKWTLAGGTNSIYTTGSNSAEISGSASSVYYYAASTSDTAQITLAASSTTLGYEKLACVRVSSGIPGYCVGFSAVSSGNYTACYVMKNFKYLGGGSCGTVSATVSHTLALVASGTSTVTLSVYVDGVLKGTVTDSSSPYTVAGSGFGLQGDGTAADSIVNEWQDYTGASPAATPTFSPAAGTYSSAQTVSISDTTPGGTIYYTTNGTAPTTSSAVYAGAVIVSTSEPLEAIATAPGYLQSATASAAYTISLTTFGCPSGSGSCFDNFTGTPGTLLPTYNSQWVLAGGTNSIYTTGSDSAEISGSASAVYYYAGSSSNTSQITLAPSSATIGYEKLACVRVSSGIPGYCVGFSAVSSGNYAACYVMKNFKYLGGGSCGTVSATVSHTLALVASGTSTVTLSVYVDGVLKGTVTDSSSPYTVSGSGFGLQGDGTPADSTVNEWQDYSGSSPSPNDCPNGSGSCVDNFTGASGTLLPTYNSQWTLAGGTNSIYTTGSDSAEISGSVSAVYYNAGSTSNTSQITLAPSSATIGYEKLACVRVSSGIPGYCVGFSAVSSGNYTACYVMKNFKYLGGGSCGTVSATVSHTLALVASGPSTVTLSIYVDGVLKGTVTDSTSPYTVAGSGFGLQGDGTVADSIVNEWQDYASSSSASTTARLPASTYNPARRAPMIPRISSAETY